MLETLLNFRFDYHLFVNGEDQGLFDYLTVMKSRELDSTSLRCRKVSDGDYYCYIPYFIQGNFGRPEGYDIWIYT